MTDAVIITRRLIEAGASIQVRIGLFDGGYHSLCVTPQNVEMFLSDQRQWLADQYGVTAQDLERYEERNGYPQCGGLTRSGRRCRNSVGGNAVGPKTFVEMDGQYCHVHE